MQKILFQLNAGPLSDTVETVVAYDADADGIARADLLT